jgi:hypothetical protein
MDKYRQIAELMKGFNPSGQIFFPATVESVEGSTCTVKVDNLSISDVRLKATTTPSENQVLLSPLPGSNVLVGSFSGDLNNLFVMSADVIDRIEITCNGRNLMQTVSDLINALSGTLLLTTSAGPATGTFDLSTIAQLKSIEKSFKQIFR